MKTERLKLNSKFFIEINRYNESLDNDVFLAYTANQDEEIIYIDEKTANKIIEFLSTAFSSFDGLTG